ncbi:MAG: hypothetical protein J6M16_06990 [Clostridia bacterium]|nr:hypothetical protein [Clostridia bacterium]
MKINMYKKELNEFEIFPKVSPVNKMITYTCRGLGIETALANNAEYIIRIIPQEEIATAKTLCIGDENCYDEITVFTDNKAVLKFEYTLKKEQIYTFRLLKKEENENKFIVNLRVFGAKEDLWQRIPMRGNTHCHACHSVDGHEDPFVVSSVYRKAGFDYLAITDHHKVDGSVFAINEAKKLPTEMALYYGEEVHVPNAYIHNVNVGALLEGEMGLDKYYHLHEKEINEEVENIVKEYENKLPEDIEPYDFAWRKWICDTIHKNGGVAILAHPGWLYDAHNTRDSMFRYAAKTGLYDAVEVMMGQEPNSSESNMQIAFWNDLRAEGINITPLGCDDAHRRYYKWDYECCFNGVFTIIYSKTPDFEGFKEAVKGGYSVAVDNYDGAPDHVVGTYRLTKFAIFLLSEYFPIHDELCFEESRLMKEAYLGDGEAIKLLSFINGRVKRFTDKFFGR